MLSEINSVFRNGRFVSTVLIIIAGLFASCQTEEPGETSGQLLYERYCASCHGLTGEGDGPVAEFLTPPPTDLTQLDYSIRELMRAIDGGRTIRVHGDSSMPVWGRVFNEELQDSPHARRTVLLQVRAIAEYVQSLQD